MEKQQDASLVKVNALQDELKRKDDEYERTVGKLEERGKELSNAAKQLREVHFFQMMKMNNLR